MHRRRDRSSSSNLIEPLERRVHLASDVRLNSDDVETILARAASQAMPRQAIVVSDREGVVLGIFTVGNATAFTVNKAVARARTAAFFQSSQQAFTTRTARFIIQDHFPHPIPNTPGGPLYGVAFSSFAGSDVLREPQRAQISGQLPLNISGDPGGIPLYKDGQPVGGIGVAGDGRDVAPRRDFLDIALDVQRTQFPFRIDNPGLRFYNGTEEHDFDEAVALAGAQPFQAPPEIHATQIFLDGLRLPFTKDQPASGNPSRTLGELTAQGVGRLRAALGVKSSPQPIDSPAPPWTSATFAGVDGELKNTNPRAREFGLLSSMNQTNSQHLTRKDVERVITDAVARSVSTRAAIREPIGVPARVHVAVVDQLGEILGVFRMDDGTNFSFDVAVQKARTAAFFSRTSEMAFSTRAIGFVSQRFFPVGIDDGRHGPLFNLQNELSLRAGNIGATFPKGGVNPLANGITIFPGGIPLYKDGQLVGAVGISGDGVDQDDIIAFAGGRRFQPPQSIRSDFLSNRQVVSSLVMTVDALDRDYNISQKQVRTMTTRLDDGLDGVRLPYVKFPRNPEV